MAYEVSNLLIPDWRNVDIGEGLFTYTFIFQISSEDQLPPGDYCELISRYARVISKVHSVASIWIQVDSPGLWFPLEIRRGLQKSAVPVAVTRSNSNLILADFNIRPYVSGHRLPPPPSAPDWENPVSENELTCLRVLARITHGLTTEVASLAGFGVRTARDELNSLRQKQLVYHAFPNEGEKNIEQKNNQRIYRPQNAATHQYLSSNGGHPKIQGYSNTYPFWGLKKQGLKIALRSWGVPVGFRFTSRLEAAHGEANRHRVTARLWPASLKKDLNGFAEIWSGWTEVNLSGLRLTPDALAWGTVDDRETLFWLEVESGHLSADNVLAKVMKRFRLATQYTRERSMNLVFGVLAMPWVHNAVRMAFMDMEPHVAVILGDWKAFGELPAIEWGRVRSLKP